MSGPLKLMVTGCIALLVPIGLYHLVGAPSPRDQKAQMDRFIAEADRRNHFIEGQQSVLDVVMWIDHYYFDNWRLPESIDDLRHGLPKPHTVGPTAYAFDPEDGSVTMFFEGREGIEDGEVTFTPTVDDEKKKLEWECWTPDYRRIRRDLPSCVYEAPE